MEIRTTNTKGLFCLQWRDSGVNGSEYFTRLETITNSRDTDVTLFRGGRPGMTLNIDSEVVDAFFEMANNVDVPIDVINPFPAAETAPSSAKDGSFSGSVATTPKVGMKAQIKPSSVEGKAHLGKEFTVASEPRVLCGMWVVALNNKDGSRFSSGYDIDMLEITDLGEAA